MKITRTFNRHKIRPITGLNGNWDFVVESEYKGKSQVPRSFNRSIYVPSVWESIPGLETYRGRAWFRTGITGNRQFNTRLVFAGVSHSAKVYVNGQQVGDHEDAFTPWDVVIPKGNVCDSELIVEVDNSFGEHSALHIPNDYYTYGGITRPVELQYVPDVFIEHVTAIPSQSAKGWKLAVTVKLRNVCDSNLVRKVSVKLNGRDYDFGEVSVNAGERVSVKKTLDCPGVKEWSPKSPFLYFLTTSLSESDRVVDDLIERIGFRVLEVNGSKLLLNGEELLLRGYNRHEDHSRFGCAIPPEAMAHDIALLKDLGCNFVRTSHYPNDQRFLDMCDEMGICVWEESHARTVTLRHPLFRKQITQSTCEMIEWHYNHPSIIIWGCLNECDSDTECGREEHTFVIDLIRSFD